MKIYLFAYGKLQPGYSPPSTMEYHEKDAVYGDLYDYKRDPLIINVGKEYTDKIAGTVMLIDRRELRYLDEEETGFKRIRTKTASGKTAYIYEWDGNVPDGAKHIKKWPVE